MARTHTRWTDKDIQLLNDTVAKTATKTEAFGMVAEKTGRSPGTVAQKYHNMRRAEGGGRPARAGSRSAGRTGGSSTRHSRGALGTLTTEELVKLIENAREVLQERKASIAREEKQRRDALEAELKAERQRLEGALSGK